MEPQFPSYNETLSWIAKIHPNEPAPLIRMRGETKPVLEFIFMLATTKSIETDEDWWQVRMIALFESQNWRN